jgi:hypothetical protein
MGIKKVTIMECDNPSCHNWFFHTNDDPAPGYHLGKGFWVMGGGGPIPATYACSPECIGVAVQANIERANA